MATMIIRDDVVRALQIEGDPALTRKIASLHAGEPIVLRIDGHPIRFRKLPRPEDGVVPEPAFNAFWDALRMRRGSTVTIESEAPADPYLLSLTATLSEWNSPEDAAAYDGL